MVSGRRCLDGQAANCRVLLGAQPWRPPRERSGPRPTGGGRPGPRAFPQPPGARALPPAAWPDSTPSSSSPAGVRPPEAPGEGRRQTGDGKCVPRSHEWSRKGKRCTWHTRVEGLFGASFVGLSLAFCMWHGDLSEWPGARSNHTAAKTPGRTLRPRRCRTDTGRTRQDTGRDARAAPLCLIRFTLRLFSFFFIKR